MFEGDLLGHGGQVLRIIGYWGWHGVTILLKKGELGGWVFTPRVSRCVVNLKRNWEI